MPQFIIYKYDFKEGEKTLLSQNTGKSALEAHCLVLKNNSPNT